MGRLKATLIAWCLTAAANAFSAEVKPGYLVRELTSGTNDSFTITLTTDKDVERIWIQPVDYSINRQGQVSIEELKNAAYSARAWCTLKPTEVVLRKGNPLTYDVPLRIPSGTVSGEYYLGVQVYTPLAGEAPKGNITVKVDVNLIVLAILKVRGGTPKVAAEILESAVEIKDATPTVRAAFLNKGTLSVITRMSAVIRDGTGAILDKFLLMGAASQYADGQAFVLPDGLRDFAGSGNRKLPGGHYTAQLTTIFANKKGRATTNVEFDVTGDATAVSPILDIIATPEHPILEMVVGSVQYPVIELKNRGFNTAEVSLSSDREGISFLPESVKLEPGQSRKVKIGVRLPAAEDPRRDIAIKLSLVGGAETDSRNFTISVYAPGTVPKTPEQTPRTPTEEKP